MVTWVARGLVEASATKGRDLRGGRDVSLGKL